MISSHLFGLYLIILKTYLLHRYLSSLHLPESIIRSFFSVDRKRGRNGNYLSLYFTRVMNKPEPFREKHHAYWLLRGWLDLDVVKYVHVLDVLVGRGEFGDGGSFWLEG